MNKLDNKISIVTGSARGLGKGIAEKLAEEGSEVIIVDINEEACLEVVEEFRNKDMKANYFAVNITEREEVKKLFEFVDNEYERIDILVNNAGINRDSTLVKMSQEQWQQVLDINLTGTFNCTQEAAVRMKEQNSGRIISISSASWLGNFGQANYAASKAGVIGLTKTITRELSKYNVTSNAICPGFIDTDMTRSVPDEVWEQMVSKIPMGRAGSPKDVGSMIAFLSSEEANYITGEVINVGGGMVL